MAYSISRNGDIGIPQAKGVSLRSVYDDSTLTRGTLFQRLVGFKVFGITETTVDAVLTSMLSRSRPKGYPSFRRRYGI